MSNHCPKCGVVHEEDDGRWCADCADPIPKTVADALGRWDAGESVFSVEMGGLGPGYEQCIQILAFELMRAWKDQDWPPPGTGDCPQEFSDRLKAIADPIIAATSGACGGFSGAQVGAAQGLAACVCRRGYRAALRDPTVKDRLIQVSRKMPSAPESKEPHNG